MSPDTSPQPMQPAETDASLTPMMRQYLETKAQVPGALLFFRLGDFYELFFEDAVTAAGLLQITLTSRSKGSERVPMCGVPYHAARRYIARLVEQGHRVAICEQLEPPGKGIVRRDVVRVVTPGTVLDDELLEARENHFLAALCPPRDGEGPCGAALLDGSTGEFLAVAPGTLEELAAVLAAHPCRELVVPEGAEAEVLVRRAHEVLGGRVSVATVPAASFDEARARRALLEHLKVATLEGFGVDAAGPSLGAAAVALRYLKDTQRAAATHVDRIVLLAPGGSLRIDDASRANLELLRSSQGGGRAGSLLGILDRSTTPLGARTVARWLGAPLADLPGIEARLDAVEALVASASWRGAIEDELKGVADLERLCGRLSLGTGGPRELGALRRSLERLPRLAARLGGGRPALLASLEAPLSDERLVALHALLERALVDEPPAVLGEGGLIRAGFHPELDELAGIASSGRETLAQLEARERERTGIASLKVRYNRVFGYYLEVTKANLHLVPADWTRRQTTVGGERYVTEELKRHEERVLHADERRAALEVELFERLRGEIVGAAPALRAAATAVGTLDALVAFARVSSDFGYVRPSVDDSRVLELVGARHPVVERVLEGEPFVANDVRVDAEGEQVLVITGPNMAGKSTVMRQAALCVVMAQAGCFVPARRARVGLVDRLFVRVGASDNLAKGQSTFMVEMTETAFILHQATPRSLVVLDEIGRGTSTFDGLSIAWAVAEHLHDEVGARTLFATHYHELTDLSRTKSRVRNCSVAATERDGRVLFLRRLVAGAASRSYGIEVARLAGLPGEVLERARELLQNLEAGEFDEQGRPRLAQRAAGVSGRPPRRAGQLQLFVPKGPAPSAPSAPGVQASISRASAARPEGAARGVLAPAERRVLEELRALHVDGMTPLAALNALAAWRALLAEGPPGVAADQRRAEASVGRSATGA